MRPSFDPAEMFPMPESLGASFARGAQPDEKARTRFFGHAASLPRQEALSGVSLLSLRASSTAPTKKLRRSR